MGQQQKEVMKLNDILEGTRCWKGYEKKGMKKSPENVPNCVKREHVDSCKLLQLVLHESGDENPKKMVQRQMGRMGPVAKYEDAWRKIDGEGKSKCLSAQESICPW